MVDLTPIAPNEAITAERLAERAAHVWAGDIAVIKSCWEQHRSPKTPEFWTEAPYMRREAAHWLLECAARAVAFDFPPDYSIRLLLRGEVRPLEEQVTHDVLLRNGVILIE